jgi:hypothetical protein
MDNKIDNSDLRLWVHEIVDSIGIREPVQYSHFAGLINNKQLPKLVEAIASYMNLPIKAKVEFVADQYQAGKINFESKSLTGYDAAGHGSEGIVAQVQIPGFVPFYGTSSLVGFPIDIKVSDNCLKSPQMFIAIMAHELTHILLHSFRHKSKENEFFTDLTAMTLGFVDIFNQGRMYSYSTTQYGIISSTTTTHTMSCGYLSDKQFGYAWDLIKRTLIGFRKSVKRLKVKCIKFEKSYILYKRLLSDFNKYKVCLDKNCSVKFKNDDALKIVSIHQANYLDHYNDFVKYSGVIVEQIKSDLKNIVDSNLYSKKNMIECDQLVIRLSNEMEKETITLKDDLNLLGRYINIRNKIKIGLGIS